MTRIGDEGLQAMEWAYATLTADAGLAAALGVPVADLDDRVWADVAPPGISGTIVTITATDPTDTNAVGPGPRIHSRVTMTVKAIVEGQAYDPAAPVARAIYAALHGNPNAPVADGGTVLTCQRQTGVMFPEDANGTHYRHVGHLFRVEID